MARFDGKVALLTGAASGIGRCTAVQLGSEGATVFGADIDEQGLAETAELVSAVGGEMQSGRFDLTRREDCRAAVAAAVAAFGQLDVLGNIAGVSKFHLFEEMPEAEWDLMLAINLSAVAFTCQAAIPHLLESKGNIVNVASVAGVMGQAYTVAYCASKGGVVLLTKALAAEYVKTGLRVNAVAPGGVATPLNTKIDFPETMDWKLVKPYMGHRGLSEPEEIADLIAYLASDQARSIHGAIFSIDGGVSAT